MLFINYNNISVFYWNKKYNFGYYYFRVKKFNKHIDTMKYMTYYNVKML